MTRRRRLLACVLPAACAVAVLGAGAWQWVRLCRDLESGGLSIAQTKGLIDWYIVDHESRVSQYAQGWRRRVCWAVLHAGRWATGGADPEMCRRGAAFTLLASGLRAGEEDDAWDVIRAARITPRAGAVLLATLWLDEDRGPAAAAGLLDGDPVEQEVACWILPLVTGHRLDRCVQEPVQFVAAQGSGATLEEVFGQSPADLVGDWRDWLAARPGLTTAQSHHAALAAAAAAAPAALADAPRAIELENPLLQSLVLMVAPGEAGNLPAGREREDAEARYAAVRRAAGRLALEPPRAIRSHDLVRGLGYR